MATNLASLGDCDSVNPPMPHSRCRCSSAPPGLHRDGAGHNWQRWPELAAAIRAAVVQGVGVSMMTWPQTEPASHHRLKVLPISNAEMFTYAYIVCLAERRNRPLIASFLQLAKEGAHRARKTRNPNQGSARF